MPILICLKEDTGFKPGEMIRADEKEEGRITNFWMYKGHMMLDHNWRLAKGIELDIWYHSMIQIPETLKKLEK